MCRLSAETHSPQARISTRLEPFSNMVKIHLIMLWLCLNGVWLWQTRPRRSIFKESCNVSIQGECQFTEAVVQPEVLASHCLKLFNITDDIFKWDFIKQDSEQCVSYATTCVKKREKNMYLNLFLYILKMYFEREKYKLVWISLFHPEDIIKFFCFE